MNANAFEIKNLTKNYKEFSLQNLNLSLPSGCILGLVGENGAGKSTTIQLMMNAAKRDSGEITILGTDNRSPKFSETKQDIGVVLDEANFPEVMTVKQVNKIMSLTFKRWDENQFYSFIKNFSLPKDKKFKDFSRGMKMKLAIATALSHHPKLLLLDEATGGLDPMVRDEILDILNDFTREADHSILMSSHIVSDLEKSCDYIAFLHKGKLLFCEEKDRLSERYGVLHCSAEQLKNLPKGAAAGSLRSNGYGEEVLVERAKTPKNFKIENVSIEEMIIALSRGVKNN